MISLKPLIKIAALLLLAVIAIDIPDAGCDPIGIPGDRPVLTSPPAEDGDACADFCVPDCFCCSITLAALPGPGDQALMLLPDAPIAPVPRLTAGIRFASEHVPKAFL